MHKHAIETKPTFRTTKIGIKKLHYKEMCFSLVLNFRLAQDLATFVSKTGEDLGKPIIPDKSKITTISAIIIVLISDTVIYVY